MLKRVYSFALSFMILAVLIPLIGFYAVPVKAEESGTDNNEYQEITFTYKADDNKTDTTGMIFNPEFFVGDNTELNPEIAKCSVGLAAAAYVWDHLDGALSQLDFNYNDYSPEAANSKGNWNKEHTILDNDFVRYVIATRAFKYNNEYYLLYAVVVQGTTASYDWDSDFNIGDTVDHEGFYTARQDIINDLYDKLSANSSEFDKDHTIVWLTGHSRGAAVANIIAGELTTGYSDNPYYNYKNLVSSKNVYGYTFACPAVSKSKRIVEEDYSNIYNINNTNDLIPALPFSSWGYKRYGSTIEVNLDAKMIDSLNFHQRHNQIFSREYRGNEEVTKCIIDIISRAIRTSEQTDTPAINALFRALAYSMRVKNTTLKETLKTAGVTIAETGWKILENKVYDALHPGQEIIDTFQRIKELSTTIYDYVIETEGMDATSFANWRELHETEIKELEDLFNYNIKSPEDLQELYFLTTGNTLLQFMGVDTDIQSISNIITGVCEIFYYFHDYEGSYNVIEIIADAHKGTNYVLYVNSTYYGYKGWYQYREKEPVAISIIAGSGIKTFGASCFEESTNVTTIAIESDLEYLGKRVASNATGLAKFSLPETLTNIPEYAFNNCSSMEVSDPAIPEGVTSVPAYAFNNCSKITGKLTIPESVQSIGGFAFYNCSGLTELEIPVGRISDGVIGENNTLYVPFSGCTGISHIKVTGSGDMPETTNVDDSGYFYHQCDGSATPWGGALYNRALEKELTIELSEGITSISDYAFYRCSVLTSINIPSAVTKIGNYAFSWCTKMNGATLPERLTEIGEYAFNNCSSMEMSDPAIPEGVTSIPAYAFNNCSSMTGTLTTHGNIISFDDHAFAGCSSLTGKLVIPESVQSIGNYAFNNCYGFTEFLTIPENVSNIGERAFAGCTGFENIIILGNVETISSYAFNNISSMKLLYLPHSITSVGSNAFQNCNSLSAVLFEGSEDEWNSISIDSNNYPLIRATKYYNATFPYFFAQPEDVSANIGDEVSFAVETYGFDVILSWQYSDDNGENWKDLNITESSITVTVSEENEGNLYRCKATDASGRTAYSKEAMLTIIGHEWNEPEYTWADDNLTVTATVSKKYDSSDILTETVQTTVKTTEATCEDEGLIVYTAEFENKVFETQIKEIIMEATGHEWLEPEWVWAEGYESATANFVCAHDQEHTVQEAAVITSERIEPTEEEDGSIIYTAKVTFNETEYTDTRTITISSTSYTYADEAEYEWLDTEDGYVVNAVLRCNEDETKNITEIANAVYSVVENASCTESGIGRYTASFENDKFQTQTKETVIEAIGHEWSEPEWIWSENYEKAEAKFICAHDSEHAELVEAVITSERIEPTEEENGSITYTAKVTFNNVEYTDTKISIIPSETYTYAEEAEYEWVETDEGYTVNAVLRCNEDETKNIVETVTARYSVVQNAKCTETGIGKYTAEFANEVFEPQVKEVVIESTGHEWSEPEWSWSEDYGKAEAHFICQHDAEHTSIQEAVVTSVRIEPTEEENGSVTYTATVYFNDREYTDHKEVTIPSVIYHYDLVGISFADAEIYLSKGDEYLLEVIYDPENTTDDKTVVWATSDENVVKVDDTGKLTAIDTGTATVTATTVDGKLSAECKVSVVVHAVSMTLSANDEEILHAGETLDVIVTLTPENAYEKLTWSSSDTSVATVDENGTVTALKSGTATITVSNEDGSLSASYSLIVAVDVTGVSLDRAEATLRINGEAKESVQLVATILPSDATITQIKWTSSDPSVATVDGDGLVTTVSGGNAVITAETEDGGYTAECQVTVIVSESGMKIYMINEAGEEETVTEAEMNIGETKQLFTKALSENGTSQNLTWDSSNSEIASIDENGLVTAKSEGISTITVKDDLGNTASCNITVMPQNVYVKNIDPSYTYTGSAIKPEISVYDSGTLLTPKTDYTVTYKNTTKAYHVEDPDNPTATDKKKAPQIIIKSNSKGNYKGSKTIYFSIDPLDINDEQITVDELSVQAGTKPVSPVPVVYFNGKKLKAKTDYTVDYNEWDQLTPGDVTIKIHGKGNFQGTRNVTVHVASSDLISVAKLNVTSKTLKYADLNGDDFLNEIASAITVKNGKKAVPADGYYFEDIPEDYKKTGTVKFTLVGNEAAGFYGKKTVTVKITGIALSDKKIKASVPSYEYTGEPQALGNDFSIKYNDEPLEAGKDYTVESYSNNINAGTATAVLMGLNNYTGTRKVTFKITPMDATGRKITLEDAYYTKGGSKPKVTIEGLSEGTDFTVKYADNKKVTDGSVSKWPTVTITFKGNYKGTVRRDFFIDPKPLDLVTITAKDKVYSVKANAWKSAPVLKDTDGKTLKAGTDYDKNISYTTADGKELPAVVEPGTVIQVTVTGKGSYTGTAEAFYHILETGKDISKATFKITNKEYTGSEVTLTAADITATINKTTPLEL
ncbi:MAG: leucine-rich repeat protein, partial [Solobacterium sp.]|nr:leucine-rich repeat protein [Solobacterium sp.]